MEKTEILKLPYIMPSQAQKHVTHNEALRQLDATIQLSVVSNTETVPPSAPDPGACYIVAPNATGAWAGLDNNVLAYLDGAWATLIPNKGWLAYIQSEELFRVWTGAVWEPLPAPTSLNNMELLGVGTQADATNKLSVSSDTSLFSHAGDDHRLVVNKAKQADTASLIFQSNYSGRAEFGLSGSDDFEVKVSGDGNNFQTALLANAQDGKVEFPQGAKTKLQFDISGRWYCYTDNRWVGFSDAYGVGSGNFNRNMGTGVEPSVLYTQHGPIIRQGTKIQKVLASFRPNHNDINGFNIRLAFQYGPWGSAWGNSSVTRDVLFSQDSAALSFSSHVRIDAPLGDYECPEDGFLLIYVQPEGTLSTTRYIYSSFNVELLAD